MDLIRKNLSTGLYLDSSSLVEA